MQATTQTPNQPGPWAPWTDPRSGVRYDADGNPDGEMPKVWWPCSGPLLRRTVRAVGEEGPDAGPDRRPFFHSRVMANQDPDRAEAIGWAIRMARLDRGLTQAQLGQRVGVSDRTISEVETGFARPYPWALAAIADALGCAPAELLEAA